MIEELPFEVLKCEAKIGHVSGIWDVCQNVERVDNRRTEDERRDKEERGRQSFRKDSWEH